MFSKQLSQETLNRVKELQEQVSKLEGERQALSEETELRRSIDALTKQKTAKEIELDRVKEQHEREKREIEHMVGLERKRSTFETDAAKREATLGVREENLKADRERFEDQMKFQNTRFEAEVGYLKDLMGEVLNRLPTVTVDTQVGPSSRKAV